MKIILLILFTFFIIVSANGAIKTWDGGGGDSNLATAANWDNDIAPVAGDDLVFPANALAVTTINNNFTSALPFRSITFNGGNYTINNNILGVTNGIIVNSGEHTINSTVSLSGFSQTFSHLDNTSFFAPGITYAQISIGNNNLTFNGTSTAIIKNISGMGTFTKDDRGSCTIENATGFSGSFASTFNGGFSSNIPSFTVNANVPTGNVINTGNTFGGSGTVGNVTSSGGAIIPGFGNFDTLTTKNLNLINSNLQIAVPNDGIFGSPIATKVSVIGTVNIENTRLVAGNFGGGSTTVDVGGSITAVINDGNDAVTGTFIGASEGSIIRSGSILFRISYIGGTGNDITLTRINNPPFDFDGDGKTDLATYRPANGLWSIKQSSNNAIVQRFFGLSTDIITPADFDGDLKTDIAVFRPSTGVWYLMNIVNNSTSAFQFGSAGDIPIPSDFTSFFRLSGDGKADFAVYRPSEGNWYIWNSINGSLSVQKFGLNGDKPVPADFEGLGKSNIAVYRPSTSEWYSLNTFNFNGQEATIAKFGITTDIPIPADFDGDGRTDYAVFRASNVSGQPDFYILQSSTGTIRYVDFGSVGDIPQTGDFDSDGKIDVAVYRSSNNTWYLLQSTGGFTSTVFGQSGDKPVNSAFIN
jgi:hypothetical protein